MVCCGHISWTLFKTGVVVFFWCYCENQLLACRLLLVSSCASFVGCQGGAQSLFYSSACTVGNLCHEVIHALGLHHEHSRGDRDQHITVQWDSVVPGGFFYCNFLFLRLTGWLQIVCILQTHLYFNYKGFTSRLLFNYF